MSPKLIKRAIGHVDAVQADWLREFDWWSRKHDLGVDPMGDLRAKMTWSMGLPLKAAYGTFEAERRCERQTSMR